MTKSSVRIAYPRCQEKRQAARRTCWTYSAHEGAHMDNKHARTRTHMQTHTKIHTHTHTHPRAHVYTQKFEKKNTPYLTALQHVAPHGERLHYNVLHRIALQQMASIHIGRDELSPLPLSLCIYKNGYFYRHKVKYKVNMRSNMNTIYYHAESNDNHCNRRRFSLPSHGEVNRVKFGAKITVSRALFSRPRNISFSVAGRFVF